MIYQHKFRAQPERGFAQDSTPYAPEMSDGRLFFFGSLLARFRRQPCRQFDEVAAPGQNEIIGEPRLGHDVSDEARVGRQDLPDNGQRPIDMPQPAVVLRITKQRAGR